MVMSRHEFLANLHGILQPMLYFEVGVQYGDSLRLAKDATFALGVDPAPLVMDLAANMAVVTDTSDHFFVNTADWMLPLPIELAFIDGDHRWEFAARDFLNIEQYLSTNNPAMVVFDDVLPYTVEMASREMVPGHWTGDVWKVYYWLKEHRPDINIRLVDVDPTGIMVCWGMDPSLAPGPFELTDAEEFLYDDDPPTEILTRSIALDAHHVLTEIRDWREE